MSEPSQAMPPATRPSWPRWTLLTLLLMAAVLVPFALLDDPLKQASLAWLAANQEGAGVWVFVAITLLLVLDIPLPIPSSIVSTAAGNLLGAFAGTLASATGMVLGGLLGYAVGRWSRGPLRKKLLNADELRRAEAISERFGSFALILSRPVPVLAEIFVVFAGIHRMPLRQFLLAIVPVNLAISCVYAIAGAAMGPWQPGALPEGLGWPLLAALGLPALGLWVQRRWFPVPLESNSEATTAD